jgi:hypothetical protein
MQNRGIVRSSIPRAAEIIESRGKNRVTSRAKAANREKKYPQRGGNHRIAGKNRELRMQRR